MPFMNVDDQMHGHRKFVKLGRDRLEATGLWTTAGSWCASALTDGFVPDYIVAQWDPEFRNALRLCSVGLWHEATRDDEKGWQFHDWNEENRNPTADEVRRKRADNAARQKRWRERQANVTRGLGDQREGSQGPSRNASSDGDRNALRDASLPPNGKGDSNALRDGHVTRLETSPIPNQTRPLTRDERTTSSRTQSVRDGSALTESAVAVEVDPVPAETTQTLVAEWLDHCRERPPGRVIGQVSKELKIMLDEGIAFASVRAGLAHWAGLGLHPSALASAVNELANARAGSVSTGSRRNGRGGRRNADDKIRDLLGDVPTFPGGPAAGPPALRALPGGNPQ